MENAQIHNEKKARIIALYLPQYHPIPENDRWWGKGFTEWTNVGKARPLFRGHYQPKVPSELGYYDLRIPEIREQQAALAKEYGIEGFCYWHYWFGNGKKLLERPFEEVLNSGKPNFPFCLAWANHDWLDKTFNEQGSEKLLMKQLYLGKEDHLKHFNYLLPAFLDSRYIRVDGKPFFMIFAPYRFPNIKEFIDTWQELAQNHGFQFHFVGRCLNDQGIPPLFDAGFDAAAPDRLQGFLQHWNLLQKAKAKFERIALHKPRIVAYNHASKYFINESIDNADNIYPEIIPNWDRTPRAGKIEFIINDSSPEKFQKLASRALNIVKEKPTQKRIIILKSWNEWGEGNYMEPDMKFQRGFLQALKDALSDN